VPHLAWNNYYANSLGFTDREFSREKPVGTRRIMALGDSSVYGMVAYPQNVQTVVETFLQQDCGDIEIMNFGIAATGVWEYRWVHKLATPRFKPDVVVVHFYMGNDGPDMIFGTSEVPPLGRRVARSSYAWNYFTNSIKLIWSVKMPRTGAAAVAAPTSMGQRAVRGGERVSDQPDMSDRDLQPSFTEEVFAQVLTAELTRFYRGGNATPHFDGWKSTLDVLDTLRTEVIASTGRPPLVVFYPSQLQVYPERFEAAKRDAGRRFPFIDPAHFESTFPNRVLDEYCRRAGLSCYDITPTMTKAAAENPSPLYKPRDTHWNVRGNRVAAEAEAAFLRHELCGSAER
jgi:hypothetical protein